MRFNKELKDSLTAYSFYSLMCDLAYSKETQGRLLDDNNTEMNIMYCFSESLSKGEKSVKYKTHKSEAAKGCSLRGIIQKFCPAICNQESLKSKSTQEMHFTMASVGGYNQKQKMSNVYCKMLYEVLSSDDLFVEWKNKIKEQIISWGFSDEELMGIIENVIFRNYMFPKLYISNKFRKKEKEKKIKSEDGEVLGVYSDDIYLDNNESIESEIKIKYLSRSLFEILDYNELKGRNQIYDDRDICKDLMLDDELSEDFSDRLEQIITIHEEDLRKNQKEYRDPQNLYENAIIEYRKKLNDLLCSESKMFTFCDEDECTIKENIYERSLDSIKKTRLIENILKMKNNPIELITSMIQFSICIPVMILSEEDVTVGENKVALLYKLFFEYNIINENETTECGNVDDNIQLVIEKIIDSSNYKVLEVEKKYIEKYITLINKKYPKEGVYKLDNKYCFVNYFICEMDDTFCEKYSINKLDLLKVVCETYDIYQNNNDDVEEKYKRYYFYSIIKYCEAIFYDNIIEKNKYMEKLLHLLLTADVHDFKFYKLCGDIYMTGISGSKKTEIDYEKAYEFYKKAYRISNSISIIKENIIPCLQKLKKNETDDARNSYFEDSLLLWDSIKLDKGDYQSVYEKFEEKCREDLAETVEKIEKKYGKKIDYKYYNNPRKIELDDSCEEVYVVLGTGKASLTFVNSVKDKEDSIVLLVPQENEISNIPFLNKWYKQDNIVIVNGGVNEVLNYIPLYTLLFECQYNENAFENYINESLSRIHFVALDGENRESNLSNIVEIIDQTYIRYKLYNMMGYAYTDILFDFSEIDIVVDSQTQTAWYLDSVINRFEKHFYIKIKHVSESKLVCKQLFTEYPLFLSDVRDEKKYRGDYKNTGKHNIVILGSNLNVIPEIIKTLAQICGYVRNDKVENGDYLDKAKKHKYNDFETQLATFATITVIADDVELIKEKIEYEAPDLLSEELEYVHTIPKFYEMKICSKIFLDSLIYNDNKSLIDENLAIRIREANYFIVATDETEKSIELAMKIRTYRMRQAIVDRPVISVYTPNSLNDEKINQFSIGTKTYEDSWHRSYDINMFGKYDSIYSVNNLYENILDKISLELHLDDDYKKSIAKKEDYYRVFYNHMSCDSRSLACVYAFYSVLGTQMIKDFTLSDDSDKSLWKNRWSMRIFFDNIHNYLKKYNEVIEGKDGSAWIEILAVLEHNRWNMQLISEGYSGRIIPSQSEFDIKNIIKQWAEYSIDDEIDVRSSVKDNKLHIAKVHFAIRSFESIGDRIGLDTVFFMHQNAKVYADQIRDYIFGDELERIRSRMSADEYNIVLEKAKDFVSLSKKEFEEKWKDNPQKTVGVDKFEALMDELANEIYGFNTTKNRQYDRQYAFDMGNALRRVLDYSISKTRKEKVIISSDLSK